ncbi:hypothetical protein BRN36_00885 [Xanthomonas oryzae pv. oryzae]|nr:hypothetical protein BRM00_15410 [Xanthomonas oryzae pv. oryzae]RBK68940.1 hypothetical protein BRN36_00885 [Xanthomonas oryzae pv. oryzae]
MRKPDTKGLWGARVVAMKRLWRAGLAAALTLAGTGSLAVQSASVPTHLTTASAAPTPAAQPSAIKPIRVDSTLTPAELRTELDASELRLRQAIRDNRATGWLEKLWPALLGLTGVLVGGWINIWLHGKQRVATEKANRASAAFEAQTQIIEYRSRQAHEFYYPLLLSLQRSSGVRRQICDHLHAKSPARFRFLREADGQKHLFIFDPAKDEPIRFRLIEAMHELANGHPEILPMVNEIVAIGKQMSKLIHDKGGLVLSSNAALTASLGRYLAHFSILREVAGKAQDPSSLEGISYNVLYPNELDGQLQSDIVFLQKSIGAWSVLSAELWKQAIPDIPMPVLTPLLDTRPSAAP